MPAGKQLPCNNIARKNLRSGRASRILRDRSRQRLVVAAAFWPETRRGRFRVDRSLRPHRELLAEVADRGGKAWLKISMPIMFGLGFRRTTSRRTIIGCSGFDRLNRILM